MFSIAAFRYRNVLTEHGGPIASIALDECQVEGKRRFQANARLAPHLVPRRRPLALYSDADGSGTDSSPMMARFMAVSEALERWAYHACLHSSSHALYGFDVDASTNGMAAFPGFTAREARRRARLEAIERASLLSWWEGECEGKIVPTRWPDVGALAIENPLGIGVTVVTFRECGTGCYAYGHAAGETLESACARAAIEMTRCGQVLSHHRLSVAAGCALVPEDVFERRCLFFSTPEGYDIFRRRAAGVRRAPRRSWKTVCDREVIGPWSEFTKVWRVAIAPPTTSFLNASEDYFFW